MIIWESHGHSSSSGGYQ